MQEADRVPDMGVRSNVLVDLYEVSKMRLDLSRFLPGDGLQVIFRYFFDSISESKLRTMFHFLIEEVECDDR